MYFIGAVIYLLDQFCNSENPSVREQTAGLFAKMITDKLVGPRVRIIMGKFLPYIFMDAMRDSPEAAVNMFESMLMYLLPPYPHPPLPLPYPHPPLSLPYPQPPLPLPYPYPHPPYPHPPLPLPYPHPPLSLPYPQPPLSSSSTSTSSISPSLYPQPPLPPPLSSSSTSTSSISPSPILNLHFPLPYPHPPLSLSSSSTSTPPQIIRKIQNLFGMMTHEKKFQM